MKNTTARILGLAATLVLAALGTSSAVPSMACCTHGQQMACCTHNSGMACCHFQHVKR
jgi:hypothetical protein